MSKRIILVSSVIATTVLLSCSTGNKKKEEVYEPTKGVATILKEVKPNEFKIVEEKIIAKKENSYTIINRLDGGRDSIPLSQFKNLKASADTTTKEGRHRYRRRSGISNILMGSLAYSYFSNRMYRGRHMRSHYMNDNAYSRSTRTYDNMRRTAKRSFRSTSRSSSYRNSSSSSSSSSRSTRKYGGSSSGRSFRSHGG